MILFIICEFIRTYILHIREIKISDKNGYYLDLKFLKIKILNSICMI